MSKGAMDPSTFQALVDKIRQETTSSEKKVEILYSCRGFYNADQASRLLSSFANPADKIRVLRILEPRLCQMTCRDGREIINAVSIHNDKLIALDCIKRVLSDYQSKLGEEYILSAFPFENDKLRAMQILQTVNSFVGDHVAAGGHQGYAALGGLYTQARPMVPHLYGPVTDQAKLIPGHGKIEIPPEAQPGVVPSIYTGHPSYAYPPDRNYDEDRGYPGNSDLGQTLPGDYPKGAPPLGYHSGAPNPTGFLKLES